MQVEGAKAALEMAKTQAFATGVEQKVASAANEAGRLATNLRRAPAAAGINAGGGGGGSGSGGTSAPMENLMSTREWKY